MKLLLLAGALLLILIYACTPTVGAPTSVPREAVTPTDQATPTSEPKSITVLPPSPAVDPSHTPLPTPTPEQGLDAITCETDLFIGEIIALSRGQDIEILKIYSGAEELERTDKILRCKAEAASSFAPYNQVVYYYEIDRDGDEFVGYELEIASDDDPTPVPIQGTPQPTFGDGTWIVGTNIEDGIYATSRGSFDDCYWERLSGFGGSIYEIIASGLGLPRSIVEILPTDAGFTSEQCGQWSPISDVVTSPEGDGTWVVHLEWPQGLYQAPGGEFCYWERTSDFTGNLESIIQNGVGVGPHIVDIELTDVGFTTVGCGDWEGHAPTVPPTPTPTPTPTPVPAPDSTPTPVPSPEPAPVVGFWDGTHVVGTAIDPGIYGTAPLRNFCHWERLAGFGGTSGEVIASASGDGRSVVEILETDVGFTSTGCGLWTAVGSTIVTPIGDGIWLVPSEWPPGTYRAEGSDACYWARLSGFTDEVDDIIANRFGPGTQVVSILQTDAGFSTDRCGAWVWVE